MSSEAKTVAQMVDSMSWSELIEWIEHNFRRERELKSANTALKAQLDALLAEMRDTVSPESGKYTDDDGSISLNA